MIIRQKINERPATVAYFTDDFEPANKDNATLAKVMFDDGEVVFLALDGK